MMKIEINLTKKHFYAIVAMFVLLIGIVGVVAYGTGNPMVNGHTIDEIEGFTDAVRAVKVEAAVSADKAGDSLTLEGRTTSDILGLFQVSFSCTLREKGTCGENSEVCMYTVATVDDEEGYTNVGDIISCDVFQDGFTQDYCCKVVRV